MRDELIRYRHVKLMRDAQQSGVSVEDMARALASFDGKLIEFDEARDREDYGVNSMFAHFIVKIENIIERSMEYAQERASV